MRTRTKKLLAIVLAALIMISAMSACKKDPPVVTPDPVTVTVKFDKQGGEGAAADKTATVGEAYGTLPSLTKAGNDFGGWFYDAAGTGSAVTAATIVVKEENHTLYAKWTAKAVTVTLDAGAGGTVSPASLTVTYGGTYGGLPTASRDGYTFGGWFVGAGGTGAQVTETTSVTNASAHTLYAKWTAISGIAVTFDLVDESAGWLGGSEAAFTGKTVTFGSAYGALPDKNDIELEDNFFGGWYLNLSEGAYSGAVYSSALVANAAAHTLYAKWIDKVLGFEIKFDLNYTSAPTIDSKYVEEHTEYGQLPEPIRTGYNFAGWFTADGVTAVTAATIAGNGQDSATVYAKWAAKETALIFNANDFTSGNGSTNAAGIHTGATATYGLAMPALTTAPTRPGYTFAGYYDAATSGTIYYSAALASSRAWDKDTEEAVTLFARWTAITYTIAYNANRPTSPATATGSGTMSTTTPVTFDGASQTLRTNAFTITNPVSAYVFQGWNRDQAQATAGIVETVNSVLLKDAATGALNLTTTASASVTLYAVWKANVYENLTFDGNKGTGTTDPVNVPAITVTLTYGQAIPAALNGLTQTSRYGYVFNGFYTRNSGGVKVYNADMTANGNLAWTTGSVNISGTVLYAQWTVKTGTVTYDTNSYAGASSTSGGSQWAPPNSYATTPFSVTFDVQSGEGTSGTNSSATSTTTGYGTTNSRTNYEYIKFINRFPTLYKTGYSFAGWWAQKEVSGVWEWAYRLVDCNTRVAIEGNHRVAARWVEENKALDFSDPFVVQYFQNWPSETVADLNIIDKPVGANHSVHTSAKVLEMAVEPAWDGAFIFLPNLAAGQMLAFTISYANPDKIDGIHLRGSNAAGTDVNWEDPNILQIWNGASGTFTYTASANTKGIYFALVYKNGPLKAEKVIYLSNVRIISALDFSEPNDAMYFKAGGEFPGAINIIANPNGAGNVLAASPDSNPTFTGFIFKPALIAGQMFAFNISYKNPSAIDGAYVRRSNGNGVDWSNPDLLEIWGGASGRYGFTINSATPGGLCFIVEFKSSSSPSDRVVYIGGVRIVGIKTSVNFSDPDDKLYFRSWGTSSGTFGIIDNPAGGYRLEIVKAEGEAFSFRYPFAEGQKLTFTLSYKNDAAMDVVALRRQDLGGANSCYWDDPKLLLMFNGESGTFTYTASGATSGVYFYIGYKGGAADSDKVIYLSNISIS